MTLMQHWQRVVGTELELAGFDECDVKTRLDAESNVFVEITHNGKTAYGSPDLALSVIADAKNGRCGLEAAFEARNMLGDTI